MQVHILHDEPGNRQFTLVFETGDPVMSTLGEFMDDFDVRAGHLAALGAFQEATLAYYDWGPKEYVEIPVEEQTEVASLVGSLSRDEEGSARVHVHCALSRKSGDVVAGHLMEARVRPTLELFVLEGGALLVRRPDEDSELELIRK